MAAVLWVPQKKRDRREAHVRLPPRGAVDVLFFAYDGVNRARHAQSTVHQTAAMHRLAGPRSIFRQLFCSCTEPGCDRALMELCNRGVWRSFRHWWHDTSWEQASGSGFIHIFKAQLAATCSKLCACRKLSEPRNNVVRWSRTFHSAQVRTTWTKSSLTKEVMHRP